MANVVTLHTAPVTVVQSVQPQQQQQHRNGYVRIFMGLGITQIIFGILSILFALISILIVSSNYWDPANGLTYVCTGIWAGVFFLVTGILGVVSSKKPESCQIVAAMTLAIFAAIAAGLMLSIEIPAAVYSSDEPSVYAFHVMMSIISVAEFFVAIVHSSFCCAASCCMSPPQPASTYITTTTTTPTPMPVQPVYQAQPLVQGPPLQQYQYPPVANYANNPPSVNPYYGQNPYPSAQPDSMKMQPPPYTAHASAFAEQTPMMTKP